MPIDAPMCSVRLSAWIGCVSASISPLGHPPGAAALGVGLVDQRHELVTAEAGQHLALPQHRLHALRRLAQHPVAGVVAVAVVDRLEVVEVDHQQGQAFAAAARAGGRRAHALVHRGAIGQPVRASLTARC